MSRIHNPLKLAIYRHLALIVVSLVVLAGGIYLVARFAWQTAGPAVQARSEAARQFAQALLTGNLPEAEPEKTLAPIDDPNEYAQTYGASGEFPPDPGEFATAIELNLIRKNGLCRKTKFYRGGSMWGQLRSVPEEKGRFCGSS